MSEPEELEAWPRQSLDAAMQRFTISGIATDTADPGVTRSTPAIERMAPEFREKYKDLLEEELDEG